MDDKKPEEVVPEKVEEEVVQVESMPVEVPMGQLPEVAAAIVNNACFTLINSMIPTNASKMEVNLQGVKSGDKVIGDFKITVEKMEAPEPEAEAAA